MEAREVLEFQGHPLIKAIHRTTFQVTKDEWLSEGGDCIIGVKASKSGPDFKEEFKRILADGTAVVTVTIRMEGESFTARARGHPHLTLTHPTDLVVRRSSYTCPRTLAVMSGSSAADIPRGIVRMLREPGIRGVMEMLVESP